MKRIILSIVLVTLLINLYSQRYVGLGDPTAKILQKEFTNYNLYRILCDDKDLVGYVVYEKFIIYNFTTGKIVKTINTSTFPNDIFTKQKPMFISQYLINKDSLYEFVFSYDKKTYVYCEYGGTPISEVNGSLLYGQFIDDNGNVQSNGILTTNDASYLCVIDGTYTAAYYKYYKLNRKITDFTDRAAQGLPGVKGDKGDKGLTGEKGAQGIQGIQGVPGKDGICTCPTVKVTSMSADDISIYPNPVVAGSDFTISNLKPNDYIRITNIDGNISTLYEKIKGSELRHNINIPGTYIVTVERDGVIINQMSKLVIQ